MYANPGISSWGKICLAAMTAIVAAGEAFPAFKAFWQPGDAAENRVTMGIRAADTAGSKSVCGRRPLLTKLCKSFRDIPCLIHFTL